MQYRTGAAVKEQKKAEYTELLGTIESAIPGTPVGEALPLGSGNSGMEEAAVLSAGPDGDHSLIGTITFPRLGVTMPVGDVLEDHTLLPRLLERSSMVIEGSDDEWQFAILSKVGMSEEVIFTDVLGHRYFYETTNVLNLDKGQISAGDLQLIRSTKGGNFCIVCDYVRTE